MPSTVLLRPAAERDRRALPSEIRQRVNATLLALEQESRPAGALKLTGLRNRWRLRIGDYRILYEIDDTARQVLILRIAHRRDVYR
jgi:mRNA interferase RelE/StbE